MPRRSHDPYALLTAGHYLSALRLLERPSPAAQQVLWMDTLRLWALNAVDPWGGAWHYSGPGSTRPETSQLVAPEDPIAAALATHRMVILMEAHRVPETRQFGAHLLSVLRAAGATHFAFEAPLQRPLDRFMRTGIARPDTEPYAFDPSRAALLRAAHTLGFQIVAFDFPAEGHARATLRRLARRTAGDDEAANRQREQEMATNIVSRILRPHPSARVVIWTGEQHAMKRTPPDWPWQHPFMAAHLAAMIGEEPYCIWQECVDAPRLSTAPQLLHGVHPRLAALGVDAIVLHHRGATPLRPAWLDRDTEAVEVAAAGAELIQMIPGQEADDAVPIVQQLVHGAETVTVRVPHGHYLIRGVGENDAVRWQRRTCL